jgi:hypothetical protein
VKRTVRGTAAAAVCFLLVLAFSFAGCGGSSSGNAMSEVDPSDTNCLDGKEYYLDMALTSGTYTYRFSFRDWNGADCFGPPSESMTLTVD